MEMSVAVKVDAEGGEGLFMSKSEAHTASEDAVWSAMEASTTIALLSNDSPGNGIVGSDGRVDSSFGSMGISERIVAAAAVEVEYGEVDRVDGRRSSEVEFCDRVEEEEAVDCIVCETSGR